MRVQGQEEPIAGTIGKDRGEIRKISKDGQVSERMVLGKLETKSERGIRLLCFASSRRNVALISSL